MLTGTEAETSTLEYYDRNSGRFTADTANVEFTQIQDLFLGYLSPGARILDFGCGSGRDSRYFLSKGFEVEACDGSQEMVRIASESTGIEVRKMLFEELAEVDRYDGIFACASILHVPYAQLGDILAKTARALKDNGILYASFKFGTFEGMRNGRYFTDMTMERLENCLKAAAVENSGRELRVIESRITGDVRPGRGNEMWLNVILKKEVTPAGVTTSSST